MHLSIVKWNLYHYLWDIIEWNCAMFCDTIYQLIKHIVINFSTHSILFLKYLFPKFRSDIWLNEETILQTFFKSLSTRIDPFEKKTLFLSKNSTFHVYNSPLLWTNTIKSSKYNIDEKTKYETLLKRILFILLVIKSPILFFLTRNIKL